MNHPVPDRVEPTLWFLTSGHWRSGLSLSVRVPGCQKLQMAA